jgi:hypothetical protein
MKALAAMLGVYAAACAGAPAPLPRESDRTCVEPWSDAASDPHAGFYTSREHLYFVTDGRTVVVPWNPFAIRAPGPWVDGCARPPPISGFIRFPARVEGDVLQARVVCLDWVDVARFDAAGRATFVLYDGEEHEMRRATREALPACVRDRWLVCSPALEPPRPGEDAVISPEWSAPYPTEPEALGFPPLETCRLDTTRSEPREGFYATDAFDDDAPSFALFDGVSIVLRDARCGARGVHRYEARTAGDALEAFVPCSGWTHVGRFDGDVLRLDGSPRPLRLDPSPGCEATPYLVCRPLEAVAS